MTIIDNMKKKLIIVSGYFNPLHKGHIEYFKMAKNIADKLLVIVNNDSQRKLKGSKKFMLEDERELIVSSLSIVDYSYLSIDQDKTVIKSVEKIYNQYKEYDIYFANGGDQDNRIIPESKICKKLGIKLIDGLGLKIQSSSWLLKKNDGN
jgi:cytidyltransferase-like protein